MPNVSAPVDVRIAVEHPPERLASALEAVLSEIADRPGSLSLSLDLAADLEAPVEMSLAVPVALRAARAADNAFAVHIEPASHQPYYPSFRGMLRITRARSDSSIAELSGTYTVPLGALGETLDATLLHGAAQSSLRRFLAAVIERAASHAA